MKTRQVSQAYFITAGILLGLTALTKTASLVWPTPDHAMRRPPLIHI